MHLHQYRLHPDWIARLEMFRRLTSQTPDAEAADESPQRPAAESIQERWPLPKISYRHRKTAAPRPR